MKTEYFYITEDSLKFNGDSIFEEIIESHITDNEQILVERGSGTGLVFENERLVIIYNYFHENGECYKRSREIKEDELNYKKPTYSKKSIFAFKENKDGLHQIGGDFSEEFKQPISQLAVPFQYLGFVNNEDPNFSWLPFKLHLAYPIYLETEFIFLDYSDSKNPNIFNIEEIVNHPTILSEVNEKSEISFVSQKFDFEKSDDYSLVINSGIPNWMQGCCIPECPKSGKNMKFICQIYNGPKVATTNIIPKDKWTQNYINYMQFFDSDLYIFIEPETKMVCMFTQGT